MNIDSVQIECFLSRKNIVKKSKKIISIKTKNLALLE